MSTKIYTDLDFDAGGRVINTLSPVNDSDGADLLTLKKFRFSITKTDGDATISENRAMITPRLEVSEGFLDVLGYLELS